MRFRIPQSHATHPNVVPMIDVIMCLIIFYMMAARIGVNTGEDDTVKIPFGALGKEIKSMDNTLLVNVKETNGLAEVSAMIDAKSGKREPLVLGGSGTGRQLVDVLRRLRFGKDDREGGAGDNKDNPDLKLVIRGDANMPFSTLQQVLLNAAQAKIKTINFQTTTQEPNK